MSPRQTLHALLLDLFSADELRRLVRALPDGASLVAALPYPATMEALAEAVIEVLERRARLDALFFSAVVHGRTEREPEIVAVQRALGAMSVAPVQPDPVRQGIAAELEQAWRDKEAALEAGEDAAAIDARIIGLRRRLRSGPTLHAGEELNDGRYKLIERVGGGGFGSVWRAWDRIDRVEVAIKVLHGQFAQDRSRLSRFFSGARQMARLRHPSVVGVYREKVEHEGFHYFVMEWLAGGDLHAAVLSGERTPVEALRSVVDVARALHFAHEQGVVHRDIKPHNVLLDRGRTALTDFDLVHAIETTQGTRTREGLGTLGYAAPELMVNAGDSDRRADVFGLGMTALFCLSGRDPTPYEVFGDLAGHIATQDATDAVKQVLTAATMRDREERTATAAEFADGLEAALAVPAETPQVEPAARVEEPTIEPEAAEREAVEPEHKPEPTVVSGQAAQAPAEPRLAEPTPKVRTVEYKQVPVDAEPATPRPSRIGMAGRVAQVAVVGVVALAVGVSLWLGLSERNERTKFRTQAGELLDGAEAEPTEEKRAENPGEHTALADAVPMRFLSIPGGTFTMGSPEGEGSSDEHPQHDVKVSPFWMAETEVTQAQWRAVMGEDTHCAEHKGVSLEGDRLPVQCVTWFEAVAFANALSEREGLDPANVIDGEDVTWNRDADGYRLPTEAEWEYAARAGTTTARPGIEREDQFCAIANVNDATGSRQFEWSWPAADCDDGFAGTAPVGSFAANKFGLKDMIGNVWEWCWDWYDGDYYAGSPAADPAGPDRGVGRVLRGGSWDDRPAVARSAYRSGLVPVGDYDNVGFRLVRSAPVAAPDR